MLFVKSPCDELDSSENTMIIQETVYKLRIPQVEEWKHLHLHLKVPLVNVRETQWRHVQI